MTSQIWSTIQQPLNLLSQLAPDFYAVWEPLQARHDVTERGSDGEREREREIVGEGARLNQVDVNQICEGTVHPWKRDISSLKVLGFWETGEDGHRPGLRCGRLALGHWSHPRRSRMMMFYIAIVIPWSSSATSCKQGNKQAAVLFNVPINGRWQEDACKFNQSSNRRPGKRPELLVSRYIAIISCHHECHACHAWCPSVRLLQ
jgi:hypothetical protein